jgi:hypothetical protein
MRVQMTSLSGPTLTRIDPIVWPELCNHIRYAAPIDCDRNG